MSNYTKYTKLTLYKPQTLLKTSNLTNHDNRLYTIKLLYSHTHKLYKIYWQNSNYT